MVWSSAAISIPSMIARKTKLRRRGLISALPDQASGVAAICAVLPAFPAAR
jgi:hypothetical protein